MARKASRSSLHSGTDARGRDVLISAIGRGKMTLLPLRQLRMRREARRIEPWTRKQTTAPTAKGMADSK